uniref:Uncharacterized protein n=1 Tax=Spongospora subterranea TaxID=70186 RepID=A0A0H5RVU7_9EUKA|eukprot:CRZ12869.1 hypothetical protein [Spongospora subterranea]
MAEPFIGVPIAVFFCGVWYALWACASVKNLGTRAPQGSANASFAHLISKSFLDLGDTFVPSINFILIWLSQDEPFAPQREIPFRLGFSSQLRFTQQELGLLSQWLQPSSPINF